MSLKPFGILLLIISLSAFSFAQTAPASSDSTNYDGKSAKKSVKKKKSKSFSSPANGMMELDFFLPEGKNSWTLSLTSSGGFAGVTRLIAAVNSNGNYLCNPDEEFRNRLLEKDVLDNIFDFVETFDFSKFSENETGQIPGCMDCSYTTLTLRTKNGFASRKVSFSESAASIKKIYVEMNDLAECRQ